MICKVVFVDHEAQVLLFSTDVRHILLTHTLRVTHYYVDGEAH